MQAFGSNSLHPACPLCGARQVYRVLHGSAWSIFACRTCTNAWTEPPPRAVDYTAHNFHTCVQQPQSPTSFKSLQDLHPLWRQSALMQADLLTCSLPAGSSILEIGCGEGLLLRELAGRGFQVAGVEPSETASGVACQSGLQVFNGYFPEVSPPGPFDAVIMSHVLEHLPQPSEILKSVQQTAPGGHVLFVQTNWKGLVPRIYRQRWYAWVPGEHYWHFTPAGLAYLFQPLGWRITKVEHSSLIHNQNIVTYLAGRLPGWLDQFHLLAKLPA